MKLNYEDEGNDQLKLDMDTDSDESDSNRDSSRPVNIEYEPLSHK